MQNPRTNALAVIDLFAGAGGLSIGAHDALGKVALTVELDDRACETLRANAKYHMKVLQADVASLTGNQLRQHANLGVREPILLIGGAPCQPFSKAAYWVEEGTEAEYRRNRSKGVTQARPLTSTTHRPDDRRSLVGEFARLILETEADGFVFENVPSITHPKNRQILANFIKTLEEADYKISFTIANAANYGVAQKRERLFVLGAKRKQPILPKPTHSMPDARTPQLLPTVNAREAIGALDIPALHEPEELVVGKWADHLLTVPPGWNYKAHTAWAGHPNPTFVTETRYWNFLLKLNPELPSWTIAASPGPWTGPFHWSSRRLRTVEMAALQSFPPDYKIAGTRRERVRQIGNAVPPILAQSMISSAARAVLS